MYMNTLDFTEICMVNEKQSNLQYLTGLPLILGVYVYKNTRKLTEIQRNILEFL